MAKIGTNSWQAREALVDRESFETHGALRATIGGASQYGRLPTEYHDSARDAVYVVYSYSTPIGWVQADGEVIVPPVKYSITTTGHQGMLYALQTTDPETRAGIWDAAARERQTARDRVAAQREARAAQARAGTPALTFTGPPDQFWASATPVELTEAIRRAQIDALYLPGRTGAQSGADVDLVRERFPHERPVW